MGVNFIPQVFVVGAGRRCVWAPALVAGKEQSWLVHQPALFVLLGTEGSFLRPFAFCTQTWPRRPWFQELGWLTANPSVPSVAGDDWDPIPVKVSPCPQLQPTLEAKGPQRSSA